MDSEEQKIGDANISINPASEISTLTAKTNNNVSSSTHTKTNHSLINEVQIKVDQDELDEYRELDRDSSEEKNSDDEDEAHEYAGPRNKSDDCSKNVERTKRSSTERLIDGSENKSSRNEKSDDCTKSSNKIKRSPAERIIEGAESKSSKNEKSDDSTKSVNKTKRSSSERLIEGGESKSSKNEKSVSRRTDHKDRSKGKSENRSGDGTETRKRPLSEDSREKHKDSKRSRDTSKDQKGTKSQELQASSSNKNGIDSKGRDGKLHDRYDRNKYYALEREKDLKDRPKEVISSSTKEKRREFTPELSTRQRGSDNDFKERSRNDKPNHIRNPMPGSRQFSSRGPTNDIGSIKRPDFHHRDRLVRPIDRSHDSFKSVGGSRDGPSTFNQQQPDLRRGPREEDRLALEKMKLRIEREKFEREKAQFLRMEREKLAVERERLAREREELRRRQSSSLILKNKKYMYR